MGKQNKSSKWKFFWNIRRNKFELALTVLLLAIVLFGLTRFLLFVEEREGVVLDDPILSLISPVDLTWFTFIIIYASLGAGFFFLIKRPDALLIALQTYIIMVLLRITAMFLLPLDPPFGMIPLVDPFVEIFGTGKLLTKDLFFSGHTATIFILYLTAEQKENLFFLLCTIMIGLLVLFQHVHYTIDVVASPFFTYAAYLLVKTIRNKS